MRRIVLKLGGSLLTQSDWPNRLLLLLDELGPNEYFLIVGGGDLVEAMRTLDRVHGLDENQIHWRCVELLSFTTEIAYEVLCRHSSRVIVERIRDCKTFQEAAKSRSHSPRIVLIDSVAFYEPSGAFLTASIHAPRSGWNTTSDAIAIFCAALVQADLCILLKSCEVDESHNIQSAYQAGIVDHESLAMAEQFAKIELKQL